MTETAEPPVADAQAVRRARFRSGLRAVGFGIVSNTLLIVVKGSAGVLGHSQGLIADAIHSAADLANSMAAFTSLLISRRPGDWNHPYGHGRAEALSATFAAFIVGAAGLVVGWDSVQHVISGHPATPDWLTLWVALLALLIKLGMAVYARRVARRIQSQAVNADARDHLTDVVATAFVIAGILLARLGHPEFDALAGLVVAGFILYTAFEIFREATHELMDTSIDRELRQRVLLEVGQVAGVRAVTGIAGRRLADITLVEVHIDVAPTMPSGELGRVVDAIKERLIGRLPGVAHVVVEANSSLYEPPGLAASEAETSNGAGRSDQAPDRHTR